MGGGRTKAEGRGAVLRQRLVGQGEGGWQKLRGGMRGRGGGSG